MSEMLFMGAVGVEYPGWHDHMAWGGWWMAVWAMLMMGGLLLLGLYAIRSMGKTSPSEGDRRPPTARAQAILAERYARGELSREEYREGREILEPDS